VRKIDAQRRRAEQLVQIQESATNERMRRISNMGGDSGLETLRMQNF
jgi:hypothetical protein